MLEFLYIKMNVTKMTDEEIIKHLEEHVQRMKSAMKVALDIRDKTTGNVIGYSMVEEEEGDTEVDD